MEKIYGENGILPEKLVIPEIDDMTVLDKVRGTITKVYEYPVLNMYGTESSREKGIIIQPDDETKGIISEAFIGRDYSQLSVGQRVVHVSYTWKRPATEDDRVMYLRFDMECPDEVDEFEYVTYDELSYDQKMQSAKTK